LNWRGVGFVLQGIPDLSSKKMNYGNHCNCKLANCRIRETPIIFCNCGLRLKYLNLRLSDQTAELTS
jgi:hypothetical protein